MKNKSIKFGKKVRAALAVVLSLQMALGSLVPVSAAPGDETDAAEGSEVILAGGWQVDQQNDNLVLNPDGSVTITTEGGAAGDAAGLKNALYYQLPTSTDYEFSVKVNGTFTENYQAAHIMIANGINSELVAVCRRHHGYLGGNYGSNELMGVMGSFGENYEAMDATSVSSNGTEEEFYLKLKKQNGRITGYYADEYSEGVENWNKIEDGTKNWTEIDKGNAYNDKVYLALAASNGGGNTATQVTFSEVRVGSELIDLAADVNAFYELDLAAEAEQMDIGAENRLTATAYNGKEEEMELAEVTYESSDEKIATVSEEGVVTGKKLGKVTITATATIGGITKSGSVDIQVGVNKPAQTWSATSPDGSVEITAMLMEDETLQYTVTQDTVSQNDVITVPASPAGIVTSKGDFSKNLKFVSVSTNTVTDTYEMYSGKRETYSDTGNETTITFTAGDDTKTTLDFIIRAYDDGAAFRYGINSTDEDKSLVIEDETTALQLPDEATIYWMNYNNASWNYEGQYAKTTTEGLAKGSKPSIPFMYIKNDIMTLFTEADLTNGTYTGSRFTTGEEGLMQLDFVDSQTTDVETTVPFTSPWRVAITGQEEDIVENTLVETLNPEADEETYKFSEWVNPGMSSWSWVANWGGGISDQSKAETHMNWIDLGEEMGWRYYILDEGWASSGRGKLVSEGWERDWFDDVKAYAAEKGVELIAWVHVSDIDTAEEREALFSAWEAEGIKGIKPDFFDSENQDTMQLYEDLYRDAAKHKLIVNVHGANKPTGEIRTWPNIYGREAVKGQEAGRITANQYTIIPFIRAAVGPTEVTEEINSKDGRFTTQGFQVALTVLVENGLHSMGSRPSAYTENALGMEYYKDFPERWVETEYVDGEIGEYVSIARKAENNDWYLSGIAVGNEPERDADENVVAETEAVSYDVPLTFLGEGNYVAMIYEEDGRNALKRRVESVTAEDTIKVNMLHGGGYAVRLVPIDSVSDEDVISEIKAPKEVTVERGSKTTPVVTVVSENAVYKELVWSSDNEAVATVTSLGEIAGIEPGEATITVASAYRPDVKAEISVTVTPEKLLLDEEKWTITRKNENITINDLNSITITTERGVMNDENYPGNNIFGIDVPEDVEDFEITARISGGLNADYQGGFIVVYDKDNPVTSHVTAGRRHHNWWAGTYGGAVAKVGMMSAGGNVAEFYGDEDNNQIDVYIKLVKEGAKFSGFYSYDSMNWKPISDGRQNSITNANLANAENLCVGLYASCGDSDASIDVTFSEFTFDGALQRFAKFGEGAAEDYKDLMDELEAANKEIVDLKQQAADEIKNAEAKAEEAKAEAEAKAEEAKEAQKEAEKAAKEAEKAKEAQTKADAAAKEAAAKLAEAEKAKAAAEKAAAEAAKVQAEMQAKLAAAEKAKEVAEAAVKQASVEVGDTCVVKNIVYKVTSTTNKTVAVSGTVKSTLKKVTIPATIKMKGVTYKVTEIAAKAFEGNKSLTNVTIGKNVTKIGQKAFYKASKLKTVKISSTKVRTIGKNAFASIHKNAKISVPKAKKKAYQSLIKKSKVAKGVKIK